MKFKIKEDVVKKGLLYRNITIDFGDRQVDIYDYDGLKFLQSLENVHVPSSPSEIDLQSLAEFVHPMTEDSLLLCQILTEYKLIKEAKTTYATMFAFTSKEAKDIIVYLTKEISEALDAVKQEYSSKG